MVKHMILIHKYKNFCQDNQHKSVKQRIPGSIQGEDELCVSIHPSALANLL